MPRNILIADDDALLWKACLKPFLNSKTDYKLFTAATPTECLDLVKEIDFEVILLDIYYSSRSPNGFAVLKKIRKIDPSLSVIMFSNADDHHTMLTCQKFEAGYASKTRNSLEEISELIIDISRSKVRIERDTLSRLSLGKELAKEVGAIFVSKEMTEVFAKITYARKNPSLHVLITGEEGVGKELVAKACAVPNRPYQALNCAGITDSILQSELFGHEKGAYTGATEKNCGLISTVKNGSLFLDELGELSMLAQASLLRAVEYAEIKRVGSSKSIKVNFRIIAATNCDLNKKIEAEEFRSDFLARISSFQIHIPPLRDRVDDIRPIINHLVAANKTRKKQKFSEDCIHLFEQYFWPGNVRQLRNIVLRILEATKKSIVTIADLPNDFLEDFYSSQKIETLEVIGNDVYFSASTEAPLVDSIEAYEKFIIKNHIVKLGSGLSKSSLASSLGIPRTSLRRKLIDLNISLPEAIFPKI